MEDFDFDKALEISVYYSLLGMTAESNDSTLYLTVPEHSEYKTNDGEELAGEFLAKSFKKAYKEALGSFIDPEDLIIKYKVRNGETWTEEKSDKIRDSINGLKNAWKTVPDDEDKKE